MPSHFRIWTSPLPPWGAPGAHWVPAMMPVQQASTPASASFNPCLGAEAYGSTATVQLGPCGRASNCLGSPVLASKAPHSRKPSVPSKQGWLSILPHEPLHALTNLQDSQDFSRLPVVLPPSRVLAGEREGSGCWPCPMPQGLGLWRLPPCPHNTHGSLGQRLR